MDEYKQPTLARMLYSREYPEELVKWEKNEAIEKGIPLQEYFSKTNIGDATELGMTLEKFEKKYKLLIAHQEAEIKGIPIKQYLIETCMMDSDVILLNRICVNEFELFASVGGILFLIFIIIILFSPSKGSGNNNVLLVCNDCGKTAQKGDTFCGKCGNKILAKTSSSVKKIKNGDQINIKYASFGRRLLSQLVDISLIWLIIPLFLNIYFYYKDKQTIGDRLLGIKVYSNDSENLIPSSWQLTGRFLSRYVTELTFGIGYLMILFTDKKQALHDKIANTVILEDGSANFIVAILISGLSITGAVLLYYPY